MMEEWLDIVDEEGNPTGKTVERSAAHREGIRHRTAHVWLARIREGRPQLLLQKRSRDKDSHPGCFDMSSGGHIPAVGLQDFVAICLQGGGHGQERLVFLRGGGLRQGGSGGFDGF